MTGVSPCKREIQRKIPAYSSTRVLKQYTKPYHTEPYHTFKYTSLYYIHTITPQYNTLHYIHVSQFAYVIILVNMCVCVVLFLYTPTFVSGLKMVQKAKTGTWRGRLVLSMVHRLQFLHSAGRLSTAKNAAQCFLQVRNDSLPNVLPNFPKLLFLSASFAPSWPVQLPCVATLETSLAFKVRNSRHELA